MPLVKVGQRPSYVLHRCSQFAFNVPLRKLLKRTTSLDGELLKRLNSSIVASVLEATHQSYLRSALEILSDLRLTPNGQTQHQEKQEHARYMKESRPKKPTLMTRAYRLMVRVNIDQHPS